MITIAAAILSVVPHCQWDNPGENRYMGDVPTSVHHYIDIPISIRDKLEKRIKDKDYNDFVDIKKDEISGKNHYDNLRDMHFGKNRICQSISTDKWKPTHVERGMVYCEDEYCVVVPTICGNLSRISKIKTRDASALSSPGGNSKSYTEITPMALSTPVPAPSFTQIPQLQGQFRDILPESYGPVSQPIAYGQTYGIGNTNIVYVPPITPVPTVPEPSTTMLLILGIVLLFCIRKLKNNKSKR